VGQVCVQLTRGGQTTCWEWEVNSDQAVHRERQHVVLRSRRQPEKCFWRAQIRGIVGRGAWWTVLCCVVSCCVFNFIKVFFWCCVVDRTFLRGGGGAFQATSKSPLASFVRVVLSLPCLIRHFPHAPACLQSFAFLSRPTGTKTKSSISSSAQALNSYYDLSSPGPAR